MPRLHCLGLLLLVGCTGANEPVLYPVAGVVTLNDVPLDDARVLFMAQGDTLGHGGLGITDSAGKYEVIAGKTKNRKGLQAGTYRVVITRKRSPDGSPPPPNVPDIESDIQETVPAPYHNTRESTLIVTVDSSGKAFDFSLKK